MEDSVLDAHMLIKFFAALLFVLGLMGGLALLLKKLGLQGKVTLPGDKKRMGIVEILPLDPRRRLMIVQRDNVQHLILLGMNGESVIETGFDPVEPDSPKKGPKI